MLSEEKERGTLKLEYLKVNCFHTSQDYQSGINQYYAFEAHSAYKLPVLIIPMIRDPSVSYNKTISFLIIESWYICFTYGWQVWVRGANMEVFWEVEGD